MTGIVMRAAAAAIAITIAMSGARAQEASTPSSATDAASPYARAVFAGGCFWCMEAAFEKVDGVVAAVSGFSGGAVDNPTYGQVITGQTGHLEAVEVRYDPAVVSYEELLEVYWRNIDPEDDTGQFCDVGDSYRTAIFVATEAERDAAQASKTALLASGRVARVVTDIRDASRFWPAELRHQDFFRLNAERYRIYRAGCGQARRLDAIWSDDEADGGAAADGADGADPGAPQDPSTREFEPDAGPVIGPDADPARDGEAGDPSPSTHLR